MCLFWGGAHSEWELVGEHDWHDEHEEVFGCFFVGVDWEDDASAAWL